MLTAEMKPELITQSGEENRTLSGKPNRPFHLRKYLPYLIFALCASLYFLPFMRLLLRGTDEGTLVEGAVRTLHGQLLGRDFFEVVGPGTFYWLALFFKLYGVTFLASRICLFVTSLGTALSVYILSRRICRSYQLLPAILVFATYFGGLWPTISHHVDSNCFALLAVVCMVRWRDARKTWLLVFAGALVGATVLILQPKGVLLLLAFLVWLWIEHRRQATSLIAMTWVAGGCLGLVVPMLGYFWGRGALQDLIYANVVWPFRNYSTVNSLRYAFGTLDYFNHWIVPMQGINWTIGMAAVLVIPFFFIAAIPVIALFLGIRHGVRNIGAEVVLYWLAGSALWLSEIHRKDIAHLVFGSPLLVILCIFYLQESRDKGLNLGLQGLSITSVCLAASTLILALFAYPMKTRVGMVGMPAYDPVLTAIDEHIKPGQEIFMYPYSPMYYFLSATINPTRYSFLVYNYYTASQFEEVTQSLDQHRVKYVLWNKNVESKIVDVLFPSERPRQYIIEPYLESHYRTVWSNDGNLLMERNNDDHRK